MYIALFPVPSLHVAFCRLQYCKRRKAGHGTGNKAKPYIQLRMSVDKHSKTGDVEGLGKRPVQSDLVAGTLSSASFKVWYMYISVYDNIFVCLLGRTFLLHVPALSSLVPRPHPYGAWERG